MATATKPEPAVILLVEDDLGDQVLTQQAFQTLRVPHELRIVGDGKEALEYLYRKGAFEKPCEAPRPDLILLDLNMPRVNGQQVAAVLNADPQFRGLPVVVLTTSRRQEDVLRAYSHGVTGYLGKPLDYEHLVGTVKELESLIQLVLALKHLPGQKRLTDRQIFRLARRMQSIERRAEALFDQYMAQIGGAGAEPATAPEAAGESRHRMLELARRIVAQRTAHAGDSGPAPAQGEGGEQDSEMPGLYALMRELQAASPRRKRG